MTDRRKILIAGAGLGGLAAAAGLLRAGHDVQVFEQAPALGEVGAGIQLSANASRVLIDLGLKQAIEAVAVRPLRTEFRLHDTAEIVNVIPLGEAHETRFGTPYYHIYRPDLHNILVDAVSKASPDCIHLSAGVRGYAEDADGGIAAALRSCVRAYGAAGGQVWRREPEGFVLAAMLGPQPGE
ncbi:MAG: hypothetical protein RL128_2139, partial [Pseudomonadota bacterium]